MIYSFMTLIHILGGTVALVSGLTALLSQKGRRLHRKAGLVFLGGMSVVGVTAFGMLALRFRPFLLLVSVFSFYLAFSGYRVLKRKTFGRSDDIPMLDKAVAVFTLACCGLFGVLFAVNRLDVPLGLFIPTVFGTVLYAGYDLWRFYHPPRVGYVWFLEHLAKMCSAFIAILAAFSGTTFTFLPPVVRDIWPSAIGTPLMVAALIYYARNFRKKKTPPVVTSPVRNPTATTRRPDGC